MRMDKLTSRFQQSLADAQSLALGRDHQFLEPTHVMLAMLDGAGGSVRPLLLKAGADVNKLRAGLLGLLESLPKVEGTPGDIHVSNDLNRVLNVTDKLAQQRGDQFISSELLVLAGFEDRALARSEEHTSELQSPCNLVCRLLLEKKKKRLIRHNTQPHCTLTLSTHDPLV